MTRNGANTGGQQTQSGSKQDDAIQDTDFEEVEVKLEKKIIREACCSMSCTLFLILAIHNNIATIALF